MHPIRRHHALHAWILAVGVGLLAASWEGTDAHANPSPVVARVGGHAITAAELERRMANVPPFQLRTFGSTPDEVRRNFLERVVVREALFAQGAESQRLASREDVSERMRGVLRLAMLGKIRAEVQETARPSDADVKAYYDKNAAKFHAPARVALWHIMVAKREEAAEVLAELKKDPSQKRWTELARERSLDKVTSMRGGNLGFVTPDGQTNEPGVTVSREVLDAVASVKDAEMVPEPIKDGERWAVVWRRQSMKAVERPLEVEAGSIRQLLLHERSEEKVKAVLAVLRKERLTEHIPDRVEGLEVSSGGELHPVRRPGVMPQGQRLTATPVPSPAPGGAR